MDEHIQILNRIETTDNWAERKSYVLREVFNSMNELILLAKSAEQRSLGTLKPLEIIEFIIEPDEREWKSEWRAQLRQYNLFDLDEQGQGKRRDVVRKLPYKYSYRFISEGDPKPRTLMIEDWELGALYWNCLDQCQGNEKAANDLVRKKYFDEFVTKKDLYLFLGTTKLYHRVAPNPFVIIGIFYPLKPKPAKLAAAQQMSLF